MANSKWVKALGKACLFYPLGFWIGWSLLMLVWGNSEQFQRAGSMGVAIILITVGVRDFVLRPVKGAVIKAHKNQGFFIGIQAIAGAIATLQWGYGDCLVAAVSEAN